MGIGKIEFNGLRYLFGKSTKTIVKTAQKVAPKLTESAKAAKIDFIRQTSIYDPNSLDYIHRLF